MHSHININPYVRISSTDFDNSSFWKAGYVFPPYNHLDEEDKRLWKIHLLGILENYGLNLGSNFKIKKEFLNESAHEFLSAWVKDRQDQHKLDRRLTKRIDYIKAGNTLHQSLINDVGFDY